MKTLSKEAKRNWLRLKLTPYMGVATITKLTKHCTIEQLLAMNAGDLSALKLRPQTIEALTTPNWALLDDIEHWAEQDGNHIVCYADPNYPEILKHISSPPEVLFVKGDPQALILPQLAIVGSRDTSISGKENAFNFARELAQLDIAITSGLAVGIDGQAHKGALAADGRTIAVLGTGVETIYPKRHKALAMQIAETGALISEFLPWQGVKAENFPKRNRIISGLSYGTLVVEAALKSGSLITARMAMEQGREVFAIPGSIHNPGSQGCHQLIKQGAALVESIHDIIGQIGQFQQLVVRTHIESCDKSPHIKEVEDSFLSFVGYEVTPVDIIAARSNLPVSDVLARLLDMEIMGKVSAVAGGYTRN